MRAEEFALLSKNKLKTYSAKIRLKQTGYENIIDTTIQARTPEMARRMLRQLYGGASNLIGQPKLIK